MKRQQLAIALLALPLYAAAGTQCRTTTGGLFEPSESNLAYEVQDCAGNRQRIVLQRMAGRKGNSAVWEQLSAMEVPELKRGQEVATPGTCTSPADKAGTVFAVVRWSKLKDGSWLGVDITHAWRFALETQKLVSMPGKDVVCTMDDID